MTVIDNAPLYANRQVPPIDVMIETEFESGMFRALDQRVRLVRVNRGIDGTQATAIISTGLDEDDLAQRTNDEPIGVRHFAQLLEEIDASLRIVIQQTNGEGEPAYLFDGYPQRRTIRWNANDQGFSISLVDAASDSLRTDRKRMILGRYIRALPLETWEAGNEDENQVLNVQSLPCHFNAGGRPNRTETFYPVKEPGSDTTEWNVHFFTEDNAPEAGYWTYAQALRYLLFWYVAKVGRIPVSVADFMTDTEEFVDAPFNPDDKNSFRRRLTQRIKDFRCDAVDVETAIGMLISDAGLHYEIALRSKASETAAEPWIPESFLRVFPTLEPNEDEYTLEMIRPDTKDIPRKAPFTAFEATADVANAPTFQDIARANAAQQATITIDHRQVNRPVYVAGTRRYECTLLLLPGWLPFRAPYTDYPGLIVVPDYNVLDDVTQTDEALRHAREYWQELISNLRRSGEATYSNQFHRAHPEFGPVADVGRKWIFPTDWRYASTTDDPEDSLYYRTGLPTGANYEPFLADNVTNKLADPDLGGGIADAAIDTWVARRRPFLSPISRLSKATTLPPLVEFKVGGDPYDPDDWYEIEAPGIQIDEFDSAIWIGAANVAAEVKPKFVRANGDVGEGFETLSDNWYAWIIEQKLYLRITCTVEGETRLTSEQSPRSTLTRKRKQIRDLGERFRYQDRRTTNTIFATQPEDGEEYDNIKDISDDGESGPMLDYASDAAEIEAREIVSGDVEIPWIDYTYRLGDSVTGVAGLGLSFPDQPEIVGIQWGIDPQGGHRTILMLSDLRSDPTIADDQEAGE